MTHKTDDKPTITFETQCYENDWDYLLRTKHLNKMIKNCNIDFNFKQVIINNIHSGSRNALEYYAKRKVDEHIIDAYYFVDDYLEESLRFFDLKFESIGSGSYLFACIVGLYLSKSEYLLHFTTDAFMPWKNKSNWIAESCKIFDEKSNIVVANPTWNFQYSEAKKEANENMIGNFYLGYGFSDQCYLVRTRDFREKILNFTHPASECYPKYGGKSFEKRIDSYMRVNKKQRITSMKESYIHYNFPKLKKIINIWLIKSNIYYYLPFLHIMQKKLISFLTYLLNKDIC
jgi:hypothetical protein